MKCSFCTVDKISGSTYQFIPHPSVIMTQFCTMECFMHASMYVYMYVGTCRMCEDIKSGYKALIRNPEGLTPLVCPRCRWDDKC
jgi:hypothetical protein